MKINFKRAWLVAKKDLKEMMRRKYMLISLITMPLFFAILIPSIFISTLPAREDIKEESLNVIKEALPELKNASPRQIVASYLANTFTPLFMMMAAIIPTITASYSFVGEKLSKSLEPLLATPARDIELLLGKYVSSFIPAMLATYASFTLYGILLTVFSGENIVFHLVWILSMLTLSPLYCILSIGFNVFISSRVSDVRTAQQIGGLIVLPALLLLFGAISGVARTGMVFIIITALALLAAALSLVYVSLKVFKREVILTRWK
jgi:ABC-2 type transport system permease protein